MIRSMRWRLLAWYAAVLAAVIVGFALLLYFQARRALFRQFDGQLSGAAEYLDANLRRLPPFETDWRGRPPLGLPPSAAAGGGELALSEAQQKQIEELDVDARNRLDDILTDEQKLRLDELRDLSRARRGRGFLEEPLIPPPPPRARERVLAELRLPPSLAPRE